MRRNDRTGGGSINAAPGGIALLLGAWVLGGLLEVAVAAPRSEAVPGLLSQADSCPTARTIYAQLSKAIESGVAEKKEKNCGRLPEDASDSQRQECAELVDWIRELKSSSTKLSQTYLLLDCARPINEAGPNDNLQPLREFKCLNECNPEHPKAEWPSGPEADRCWSCRLAERPGSEVACSSRRDAMATLEKWCVFGDKKLCSQDRMACKPLGRGKLKALEPGTSESRCLSKPKDLEFTGTVGFTTSVPTSVPGASGSAGYQHQVKTNYRTSLDLSCRSAKGNELKCAFGDDQCLMAAGATCQCELSLEVHDTDLDTAHFEIASTGGSWTDQAGRIFKVQRSHEFPVSTCSDQVAWDRCKQWRDAHRPRLEEIFQKEMETMRLTLKETVPKAGKEGTDCTNYDLLGRNSANPAACGLGLSCEVVGVNWGPTWYAPLNPVAAQGLKYRCVRGKKNALTDCAGATSAGAAARCCWNAIGEAACMDYNGSPGATGIAQKCCQASGNRDPGTEGPFVEAGGGMCLQLSNRFCREPRSRPSYWDEETHSSAK